MSKRKSAVAVAESYSPEPSRIVAIVNDIHFDLHDVACWRAFRRWHEIVRPWKTILNGDLCDFGMLSRWAQEAEAPTKAIPQILMMIDEVNPLADEAEHVVVREGNHDERWSNIFAGPVSPVALAGAIGLTLEDQCRAQGLDPRIAWTRQDNEHDGINVGQFKVNHGHREAGKHGAPRHLAANRITKTMGACEVLGHSHRAQMVAQSSYDKTAIVVSSPSLTHKHKYAQNPDWQNGFVTLDLSAPDYTHATPHLIIMESGRFSWGGLTFDGNR